MASTSSPNLKLELIGTGEQQGTWGSTTNTNLGTLLEEAIGGYAALAMADSDQTLTMTPYAAATARNMTIEFTGALTAARAVSLSAALEKVYIVKNSTTGGFAVTFKVTGQTGVSIPSGATYILYVDGTDARQATGSVVSGGTGTTTSTGTGSVVLSDSPTFTSVPISTTAAADTNTTQVATTAYVVGQASSTAPVVDGVATVGTSLRYARADHIHPTDTSRAPLNSPSLTGTPLSITAAVDTNTTQIATTAYVMGQGYAKLASPTFTGTPSLPTGTTAVTQTAGNNSTAVATTAFVTAAAVPGTGRLLRAPQVLTSGTSYTTPASCTAIYVEAIGGGGGSGGVTNPPSGSGGGGGGAYLTKYVTVSASTAYTIAIGAGGTAGTSTTSGGNGGATSITVSGTTYSAGGGVGSIATSTGGDGGAGGTTTNADFGIPGREGSGGTGAGDAGFGGASFWSNDITGGYGQGAEGRGDLSGGGAAGFAGSAGIMRIWEYA